MESVLAEVLGITTAEVRCWERAPDADVYLVREWNGRRHRVPRLRLVAVNR